MLTSNTSVDARMSWQMHFHAHGSCRPIEKCVNKLDDFLFFSFLIHPLMSILLVKNWKILSPIYFFKGGGVTGEHNIVYYAWLCCSASMSHSRRRLGVTFGSTDWWKAGPPKYKSLPTSRWLSLSLSLDMADAGRSHAFVLVKLEVVC